MCARMHSNQVPSHELVIICIIELVAGIIWPLLVCPRACMSVCVFIVSLTSFISDHIPAGFEVEHQIELKLNFQEWHDERFVHTANMHLCRSELP